MVGSIAGLAGVPAHDSGMASGLNTAAFHLGGALGIAILTTVATSWQAVPTRPPRPPDSAPPTPSPIVFAAVGTVAALVLLGRRRTSATRRRHGHEKRRFRDRFVATLHFHSENNGEGR